MKRFLLSLFLCACCLLAALGQEGNPAIGHVGRLYDACNRLTDMGWGSSNGTSVLEYAANGNILKKSGVGSYTYGMPGKPHAVTGISPGGALTSGWGTQEVFYTKALRPDSLHEGAFEAKFVYNGHLDKVKMTVTQGQGRSYLRKYYLGGCYELEESSSGPARERLYLGGDYYDAPVMWEKTGPLAQCHSLLRDYLGSITHVVRFDVYLTNELSHDAWGARRSPTSHSPEARPSTLSAPAFSRGFCGHEHLGVFGLVDMGARLYDPVVGRFLSPDPHVQIPGFSQVLNRYTYCMNNPLVHVDENGETPLLVIGAAALIGGTANLGWKAIHGQIDDWGDAISAFGIGAAAGGFGAAAGFVAAPIAGAGFLGGFVEGAFSGVVSSSILSVGNSQAFGDPQMGWKGYVWSAIGAGVVGGVVNGGVAASQGKNFWTGKGTPNILPSSQKSIEYYPEPQQSSKIRGYVSKENQHYFVAEPDGTIHDLGPELKRIGEGKTYTFRHDNERYWNKYNDLPTGIDYTEYICPPPRELNIHHPGPRRIITGNNGSIWFTPDHHNTFIPINWKY